MKSASDVDWAS